jgi:cytochrome b561
MARSTSDVTPVETYARPARVLHWLTALLLAVQVPVGFYMVHRGGTLGLWDGVTNTLYSGHKLGGVVLLALVLLRLAWRLGRGAPPAAPTTARWQRVASGVVHAALYGLLVALPVVGYIGVARFPALELFGGITLPALLDPDETAAKEAFALHALLGWALIAGIAVHVAAALFHHFVRRDEVLARMLPSLRRRSSTGAAPDAESR